MKLAALLKAIGTFRICTLGAERRAPNANGNEIGRHADLPDSDIGSIHYRAQEVQPGGIFVAIEGQTADGHDFMHF